MAALLVDFRNLAAQSKHSPIPCLHCFRLTTLVDHVDVESSRKTIDGARRACFATAQCVGGHTSTIEVRCGPSGQARLVHRRFSVRLLEGFSQSLSEQEKRTKRKRETDLEMGRKKGDSNCACKTHARTLACTRLNSDSSTLFCLAAGAFRCFAGR